MDTYENYGAYNRHLSLDGFRVNTSGTKPSAYITEVKLKRAVGELSDIQVEDIFENEMTPYLIKVSREKLVSKILSLHKWQLFKALDILLTDGNYEAIYYVKKCKRTDKPCN